MKIKNLKYLVLSLGLVLFTCSDDDETCTDQIYYQDLDGDGEGNPNEFVASCNPLDGFVSNADDPIDNDDEITSASIWNGPSITVTKADDADWTLAENQDMINANIILTREDDGGLINIVSETNFSSSVSPKGTLWAQGTLDNIPNLDFDNFRDALDSSIGNVILNGPLVLYLIEEKVFMQVEFTSWTTNDDGGGFSYTRTTAN